MDPNVKAEINDCITEIDKVIREINKICEELTESAQGIGIKNTTEKLLEISRKYKNVRNELRRLQ